MKVLGVITARGGSKGVPKKNIKKLNGKPLIYYTIQAAKNSKLLTDFCVSTDSNEIKKICLKYNAKVPFKRPKKISEDVASEHVIIHALNFYKNKNINFDAVMLLQPTSPFRSANSIDMAIKVLQNNKKIDSVFSAEKIDSYHPDIMFRLINHKVCPYTNKFKDENHNPVLTLVARQDLEDLYKPNGSIYIVKTDFLLKKKIMISSNSKVIISSTEESFDIDTKFDFEIAELLMKKSKYF